MAKSRTRSRGEAPATWERHLAELRRGGVVRGLLRYAGVDLSLRSTGLFIGSGDPRDASGERAIVVTPEHMREQRRLDLIVGEILGFFSEPLVPAIIMFEAPSFGSGDRAHAKGALHGVVKRELWLRGYWIADIPPTSLKVFAAGRNVKKPALAVEVFDRWGVKDDCDDVVDAFACSRLAAAYVHPLGALAHWKRAIDKVRLELPRIVE